MERIGISKRLKELRKSHGYTQAFVAKNLFVSQPGYALMENNSNAVGTEHIVRLGRLYKVTTDLLLTGNKGSINMTPQNGFMPYVKVSTYANLVQNSNLEKEKENFECYKIRGYSPTKESILIEIEGDGTQPAITSGDILVCQIQKNLEHVLDGIIAIVITRDKIITTRLFNHEDDNYFYMKKDKPDKEDKKEFKKSEILQLLFVVATTDLKFHLDGRD